MDQIIQQHIREIRSLTNVLRNLKKIKVEPIMPMI